jgi:hypothetical protein
VAGALIVTAELGGPDHAWLDRLRRKHFPPERNVLSAHLTMFHAIPPSSEPQVKALLSRQSKSSPPRARIEGLMNLGAGVAYRVASPDLDRVREELSQNLHGLLSAQDSQSWRPHVTIQNKVAPKVARALVAQLEASFIPRPLLISGLGLHRYMDGPWERIRIYPFRGC